jgi:hypothetical protein
MLFVSNITNSNTTHVLGSIDEICIQAQNSGADLLRRTAPQGEKRIAGAAQPEEDASWLSSI